MSNQTQTDFTDGVLTVTRTYAASRQKVFEAWVDASKVQQWWGCGDTVDVKSNVEPKVGGAYTHKMKLSHGMELPGDAVFTKFDPPKLLAYAATNDDSRDMEVTVEFIEQADETLVRLTHTNIPEPVAQYVRAGWIAAIDKLSVFLLDKKAA